MEAVIVRDDDEYICWGYFNEKNHPILHREGDKPAIIHKDRCEFGYRRHGLKHRDNDQPATIHYYSNGIVRLEEFYVDNQLHRESDKPATSSFDMNGLIRSEQYWKNGVCHREMDNPATIKYESDGFVSEEIYYKNGVIHRDGDRPAYCEYSSVFNSRGEKEIFASLIKFLKNGELHRERGKPSFLSFDDNSGELTKKMFHVHGRLHREGSKPALVEFHNGDKVKRAICYKWGVVHAEDGFDAVVINENASEMSLRAKVSNGKMKSIVRESGGLNLYVSVEQKGAILENRKHSKI